MKDWIIISPDGVTIAPNEIEVENFQVLGFVMANTEEDALKELRIKYQFLNGSGFDEVWIYPLLRRNPFISHLGRDSQLIDVYEDEDEKKIVETIIQILDENGFSDILYDYREKESYFFEASSNALQEIRVDIEGDEILIYDRYITEKHFVYFRKYLL